MRFHQIKEIYQHIKDVNREFETFCQQLLKKTKDERLRMFIHYLIDKQDGNNDYLDTLIKSESHKVTDSWVDEDIEHGLAKKFIEYKQQTILSIDEILAINIEIIETINDWLLLIVDLSTNQTVKEHILDLIERQSQQSHKLVHSAHRMDDM
ncbi:hypothetical protein [Colwellia hornerae]|uniref:DUF2383 domain-containing protein n=1 Tax=Colwellia hornerae TaxID=89402 RepID=A0A5C6QSG9_9GAMM|nr:hypothetical protein [Colwellia hornerae]TWX57642.1 hypothetical protein ESZ28_02685 [Colwellia hornerae]TWX62627.1 hypothetical protein ESZ26_02000 [Colwellia hornerae]TWX71538.1 hypothetical protein ESZ27_01610 [Colwellia hornerae]